MRDGDPRIHIACGHVYKHGWTNIDLVPVKVDIPWNLKRGIPFADETVSAVFHEHFLEHVPFEIGFTVTQECRRVLRPGGVLRIGVPDAGACLASYAGLAGDDWARSAPTPMIAVLRLFYEHGHVAMYDAQTLVALCLAAGFAEATRFESGRGRLGSADSPERASGTLYIEAVKAR
jgi:predicted SAM-dependent methyltransferase